MSSNAQMNPASEKNTHGVKFDKSNIGTADLLCKNSDFSERILPLPTEIGPKDDEKNR